MRSILSALLYLIGVAMMTATVYFSFDYIAATNQLIDLKKIEDKKLAEEIEALKRERERLVSGPIEELVAFKSVAIENNERVTQRPGQHYDFLLWLDVPNNRKADIARVEYRRRYGDVASAVITGTEPTNGFATSYYGWGCFPVVDVSIVLTSGEVSEMTYNQCRQLGWRL